MLTRKLLTLTNYKVRSYQYIFSPFMASLLWTSIGTLIVCNKIEKLKSIREAGRDIKLLNEITKS